MVFVKSYEYIGRPEQVLTVMLVLSFYSCFHINTRIKFVGGNLFDNYSYKVFLLGFIKPERDKLSY